MTYNNNIGDVYRRAEYFDQLSAIEKAAALGGTAATSLGKSANRAGSWWTKPGMEAFGGVSPSHNWRPMRKISDRLGARQDSRPGEDDENDERYEQLREVSAAPWQQQELDEPGGSWEMSPVKRRPRGRSRWAEIEGQRKVVDVGEDIAGV